MIHFNEGVPRAGKSYDAVKNHILPAVMAGRRCFVRLNGVGQEGSWKAWQEMTGKSLDELKALIIPVSTPDVHKIFIAKRDMQRDGEWSVSPDLLNSLVVIDECHEFYVAGKVPIAPAVEQFFALAGQSGIDIVLMSQYYRRLHSSVRGRVERKAVFQKLTAVGKENSYTVARYQTLGPDKFEKVTTDVAKYDPKIYPLYRSYAEGVVQTGVYSGGKATVWKKILPATIIFGAFLCVGIWLMLRFFHPASKSKPHPPVSQPYGAPVVVVHAPPKVDAPVKPGLGMAGQSHQSYDTTGMPAPVAYVFDLLAQTRPRLMGRIFDHGVLIWGGVEFRQDQGHVLDRLNVSQLRSMGLVVVSTPFGLVVSWEKSQFVVTSWPVDMPGTYAPANEPSGTSREVASYSESRPLPSADSLGPSGGWHQTGIPQRYTPPEQTTLSSEGSGSGYALQ